MTKREIWVDGLKKLYDDIIKYKKEDALPMESIIAHALYVTYLISNMDGLTPIELKTLQKYATFYMEMDRLLIDLGLTIKEGNPKWN